jgi:chaperonin GroEL (HSP60 family)
VHTFCTLLYVVPLQVVVSGGNIGEMAMHFLEKYGLLVIRIPSKFDLRRFCRATGSVALVKLQTPQADELGFAKQVGGTGLEAVFVKRAVGTESALRAAGGGGAFVLWETHRQ